MHVWGVYHVVQRMVRCEVGIDVISVVCRHSHEPPHPCAQSDPGGVSAWRLARTCGVGRGVGSDVDVLRARNQPTCMRVRWVGVCVVAQWRQALLVEVMLCT